MMCGIMNRTNNAIRNIIWGIVGKIVTLGMPFLTRTVMIYTMGMEYVGLGSLFTSILQVLSFAELGIGSTLVFSMYKPIAEGDDEKVCALLNFYRKTYRIIGGIILSIGLFMLIFLKYLIAGDIPDGINIQLLFVIYLINNVLGYFLFAYKQSLFTASQRIDMISKIGMVLQLVSNICQIFVLVIFRDYYFYVIIIPIITCINNIIIAYLTNRYYPQYKCCGVLEKKELSSIKKKVSGMMFQKIGGIVLTSVDTLVISSFLGLVQLAQYQNYYYIISALFGILTVIQQSLVAGIGNSVALESFGKNYINFKKFNFVYIWIVSWCTICLLCLFQPFMELWVGKSNTFSNYIMVLFCFYFYIYKWCDMLAVYQEACGIWWESKFVPLTAAMVNLITNIFLIKIIGIAGVLISTIISILFIYDTGYARVLFNTYFRKVNKGLFKFWIRQGKYFITLMMVSFITVLICDFVIIDNIMGKLIIRSLICILLPNLLFILIWKKFPEFQYIKEILKKISRKKDVKDD